VRVRLGRVGTIEHHLNGQFYATLHGHSASELARYWRPKALAGNAPHQTERAAEFRRGPSQLELYA
jgi:hypothetical protein